MTSSTPDNAANGQETDLRQVIVDALDPQNMERRTSERYGYSMIQTVAPCESSGTPEDSAFQQVVCRDISRGGLAFLWPQQPDFEYAMIWLSNGPGFVRLRARVLHWRPATDPENRFLVSCQFVERVE